MRKFIIVLFAAMLGISSWAQSDQDWAQFKRYEAANQEVIRLSSTQEQMMLPKTSIWL